ncbi:uncharacterized protein LOC116022603 [Ipomoea triloba]|uniref:uncharacterized protein LOC116022603 n=1 Tax=Ipomoea triloba TaxID=35885 RepID=UPI00125DDDE9|nr:uncharacterized protein LOC116022603 [Ipomoea triloba]
MLELKGGGEWFRRHLSVVVVSTLIASVSNGYANQKTVHMFRDVDRITDLDWCGYLLRSLVVAHGHWTQDRTRKFMGPLLFLILLYADRVVVGGRDVPRSIPTLNGWTTELLKAREAREITAQGFGQGMLDDPPHPTDFHAPSVEASLTGQPIRLNTEPGTLQPGPTLGTPQGFAQLFESKTGDLVLVATQVADMVRQNPNQAYDINPHT